VSRPPRRPPAPPTGDLFAPRAVPGPAAPLTVLQLTQALKAAVEPRFGDVHVRGEVANLRVQSSGHVYFTLKDEGATLPCVLWATQARRLRFELEEGLELVAHGRIEIYPPHGKYQLVATEVEPHGAGALALQLEQLKARLAAEGLLAEARKRPLPFLPRRIGVATSTTTAALRDFLRVLHGRFPGLPVLVAPCRVQGEGAAATVAAAVKALARHGVEVIVVTRGGGSREDLWAFNDELLARTIAASPVPVVSAVGHETDVSLCDLVCDLNKEVTVEQINGASKEAAAGRLKGILEYCDEPLVSSDFKGNQNSSIFDSLQTLVLGGNMAKIIAWYDNEWGYSCRMADLALMLFDKGL